jgi:hypothetical protein
VYAGDEDETTMSTQCCLKGQVPGPKPPLPHGEARSYHGYGDDEEEIVWDHPGVATHTPMRMASVSSTFEARSTGLGVLDAYHLR